MADEDLPTRRTCGTMQVHQRLLRTVAGYRETRGRQRESRSAGSVHAAGRPHRLHQDSGRGACRPSHRRAEHFRCADPEPDRRAHRRFPEKERRCRFGSGRLCASGNRCVEFELATIDPSGNPTNGITRTTTTKPGFTDDDAVKSAATGGADPWPSDKYLNIWVCQLSGGLLGYAQFPGGPAATDGVVILHSAFGTTGTAAAPFNLGRGRLTK